MGSRPEAQILLVEDNPGDVRLLEEAFRAASIDNTLHAVTDGREALDFVNRNGDYADAVRPDIILLDLNLPRVDGEDVLHEIKQHPDLGDVPVVILSGTDGDLVKSRDLDHDADEDAVLEKPVDPGEFVTVIGGFDDFRVSVHRAAGE